MARHQSQHRNMTASWTCLWFACLLVSLPVSHAFRPVQEYQAALNTLIKSFTSPSNKLQADAINSTLLAEDIMLRVDISENYPGRELGTEYVWGLFANAERAVKNGTTQLVGYPVSATLASSVIQPPVVFASVILNFSYPTISYELPVQLDLIIRINDKDLTVSSWDVSFRRFAESFSWLLEHTTILKQIAKEEKAILLPTTNFTQLIAHHAVQDIFNVHEQYCTGPNAQYKSKFRCMQGLMNKKFGQPWQGGQDTVFCRYLHKYMIPFRPSVHCPHIGLNGGGMCGESDYVARVLRTPFTESLIGGV